jgi:putative DNA primase/helicase
VLFYCHSGCTQSEVIDALGLFDGKRDDYVPAPRIRPEPKPKSDYYKKIWNNAYDVLLPFSKPFKGDINHLVSTHPYALFKDIGHEYGARRGKASGKLIGKNADVIVVPSRDIDGNLIGVECIGTPDPKTGKTPKQSFGRKGLLVLGNDLDPQIPMLMFEGWNSAIGWLEMEQNACAVIYFGKSSAVKVYKQLTEKYPNHVVLLAEEQDD